MANGNSGGSAFGMLIVGAIAGFGGAAYFGSEQLTKTKEALAAAEQRAIAAELSAEEALEAGDVAAEALRSAHERGVSDLKEAHASTLATIKDAHKETLAAATEKARLQGQGEGFENALARYDVQMQDVRKSAEEKLTALGDELTAARDEKAVAVANYNFEKGLNTAYEQDTRVWWLGLVAAALSLILLGGLFYLIYRLSQARNDFGHLQNDYSHLTNGFPRGVVAMIDKNVLLTGPGYSRSDAAEEVMKYVKALPVESKQVEPKTRRKKSPGKTTARPSARPSFGTARD